MSEPYFKHKEPENSTLTKFVKWQMSLLGYTATCLSDKAPADATPTHFVRRTETGLFVVPIQTMIDDFRAHLKGDG
jgi:hypothetical protein